MEVLLFHLPYKSRSGGETLIFYKTMWLHMRHHSLFYLLMLEKKMHLLEN